MMEQEMDVAVLYFYNEFLRQRQELEGTVGYGMDTTVWRSGLQLQPRAFIVLWERILEA